MSYTGCQHILFTRITAKITNYCPFILIFLIFSLFSMIFTQPHKINKKLHSRLEKVNSMNYLILGVPYRIILRTIFEELTLPVWDIIIIVSIFFDLSFIKYLAQVGQKKSTFPKMLTLSTKRYTTYNYYFLHNSC